jgi:hypothetical protein
MGRIPRTLNATKRGMKGRKIFREINCAKMGSSQFIEIEYTIEGGKTRTSCTSAFPTATLVTGSLTWFLELHGDLTPKYHILGQKIRNSPY